MVLIDIYEGKGNVMSLKKEPVLQTSHSEFRSALSKSVVSNSITGRAIIEAVVLSCGLNRIKNKKMESAILI